MTHYYYPTPPTTATPAPQALSVRALRQEAKDVIYTRGRLLRLVLLGTVGIFLVTLPYFAGGYLWELLRLCGLVGDSFFAVEILPYVLMLPFVLFVTAPCSVFGMRAARHVIEGRVAGHVGYLRALRIGLCLCLRAAIAAAPTVIVWTLPLWREWVLPWILVTLLRLLATAAAMLLGILVLLLSCRFSYLAYYAAEGRTLRASLRDAGRAAREGKGFYRRLLGSFCGLLALSVLSIGVLFILYVLPLMAATYCLGLRRLSADNPI